jgi:ribose 1,5-bisphosphokinase PhnN
MKSKWMAARASVFAMKSMKMMPDLIRIDMADVPIEADAAIYALRLIARGRDDFERPLMPYTAQHLARETLKALQIDWREHMAEESTRG